MVRTSSANPAAVTIRVLVPSSLALRASHYSRVSSGGRSTVTLSTDGFRVAFEVLKDELKLCVEDDGVGFRHLMRKDTGMGQDLVSGLAGELAGHLEVASTSSGSSFRLYVPFASPVLSTRSEQSSAASIH
jgi:signal transduction histidine kinase